MLHCKRLLPFLILLFLLPAVKAQVTTDGGSGSGRDQRPVDVGVVLDMGTRFGKVCFATISMAVEEFYTAHSNYATRLVIHEGDSDGTTLGATLAAHDLLSNVGVAAIIGPQRSGEALFVSDLGTTAQVPVVSFSATSPSVSDAHAPYFVRATLKDSAQVAAVASLVGKFRWREAILVYEDSEFGSGIVPYLIDALQDVGAHVPYRCVVSPWANGDEVADELMKLMGMHSRVFIVHMNAKLGSILFAKAAELGMIGEGYVWIMTSSITMELGWLKKSVISNGAMQGVLGFRPYVAPKVFEDFTQRWKVKFQQLYPNEVRMVEPNIFSLWAYDTVWALAMAAESVGWASTGFQRLNINTSNLRISPLGPKLLSSILRTHISGKSGRFQLVDGQLELDALELIDVVGNGIEAIGYWTPTFGLSRYRNSKGEVEVPIWPGKEKNAPKGWEWPTKGKKLIIGVPVAPFVEFAKVEFDYRLNRTIGSGFCVDVFQAAVAALPYEVPYEYVLYADANGNPTGSYEELVYQVYLKNFDVVVGDMSILFNRSLYVDFTTPYTESGVVMIMAVKETPQRLWAFLDPMTHQLWLATVVFFVFTGFVIWVLEHQINDAFRGTPFHQLGTFFYFSFSTMIFASRENVSSNLSRVVVIVWYFFILVLTSSYTASLSSMLTSQQLQSDVTDVKDLIHREENVGYLRDSFVRSLLIKLGFDDSKLIPYRTPEECAEALSKGSYKGGVAAIFDELPYVRLFLSKYPEKYTVVGRTYRTDGFGFIFPRGSPLLTDISRAILTVKEGEDMIKFEKELYGDLTHACLTSLKSPDGSMAINRLSFRRYLGLFLITGITSTSAIVLHVVMFLYRNWHVLDSHELKGQPFWQKLVAIARVFYHKDSSHTFRKNNPTEVANDRRPSVSHCIDPTPRSSSDMSHYTNCESDVDED